MAIEDEEIHTGISGTKIILYLVVAALAVIGFLSIIGTIFATVAVVVRAGFYVVVIVAILWALKSIFIGRSSKRRAAGGDA